MNTDDAAEPAPFRYHAVRNGDWGVTRTRLPEIGRSTGGMVLAG